jgi:hypothetical protein
VKQTSITVFVFEKERKKERKKKSFLLDFSFLQLVPGARHSPAGIGGWLPVGVALPVLNTAQRKGKAPLRPGGAEALN